MNSNTARFVRVLLAAALTLGISAPTLAGQNSASGDDAAQDQVSRADLEKFASAYSDLRSVRAEYMPKIQQADGKEEKAQLKKEGQKHMVQAVRSNGLKVAEYQAIGQKLNDSKALQTRLRKIMQEQAPAQEDGAAQTQ